MDRQAVEIAASVERILETVPPDVIVVAAAKERTAAEVQAAIRAGIRHVGHNYVQEAQAMFPALANEWTQDVRVSWHMIGHLQRNKVKRAVQLFDMIETIDSWRLAVALDRRCAAAGQVMSVLMEINSGREARKTGVLPQDVDDLIQRLNDLQNIHVQGLMTMGPRVGDAEQARPYFRATRAVFERVSAWNLPNVTMRYLSMGMSNSYQVAIEEGANLVRIGTKLFGRRP
jgi:pyridoxal phosphate enzyme (YggS family)